MSIDQATADAGAESLLADLVDEITQRLNTGESVILEEYVTQYPQFTETLGRVLEALTLVRQPAVTASDFPLDESARPLGHLGDFRILRELGRGGMGVVYEAEQISLGRRVALKVLPFAAMLDKQQLARFKNEARAVATLDHPNIVAVYSVGVERGVHYYAMQLIEGQSLAQTIAVLRERKNLPAPPAGEGIGEGADTRRVAALSTLPDFDSREYFHTIARLGFQAAEALDHAHKNGILHRDVKPANLLLDDDGKLWITDFGLARIDQDAGITMTGDLLGTLRYMSPEQALAKRAVVDHRSDIYSLGVTLYELLTLRPAYAGDDRQELLRQIAFDEPRAPRQISLRIPKDLETIILKAIEKNQADRYATAKDLVDDLRRFLENQPIKAKPATYLHQLIKWSRRHVAVAWTALGVSLLAVVILGITTTLVAQSRNDANAQRLIASHEKDKAIDQRDLAKLNQYYAEIVSGQANLEQGNLAQLQQKLIRHLPLEGEADHRGWEWYYLFSFCDPERRTLYHPRYSVFASWSPDGEYIATAGAIWNAKSGECIRLFSPSITLSKDVAWSSDSQKFAWGDAADDSAIYIWNRQTDNVSELHGHASSVWCVVFSPDGKQLASGSLDNTLKIWDLATSTVVRTLQDDRATSVDWSSDGELLGIGDWHGLTVWNASTGERVLLRGEANHVRVRVSWSPDGRQLAINTPSHWYILDRRDWHMILEHNHPSVGTSNSTGGDIKWNPAGTQLAISHGGGVAVWDRTADQPVTKLAGHIDPVNSVGWSPDGKQLVTTDAFREIRIWDLERPLQPHAIAAGAPLERLSWEADSDTLVAVAASDLAASFWSATDGNPIKTAKPAAFAGTDAGKLSPDGRLIAHLSREDDKPSITVRDALSGAVHAIWRPAESFEPVAYGWSPDGSKLAITIDSPTHSGVEFWNVDHEQRISCWTHPKISAEDVFNCPTWSSDGARVALVGHGDLGDNGFPIWSSHVHVIDVASGERILKRSFADRDRTGGLITALAWSPDRHFLALGSSEGWIDVVNVETQRGTMSCKASEVSIGGLDWNPDGQRLATAAADGAVKVVEARRGNELLTLHATQGGASHVAWSPDGKRLAAGTTDGTIQVWDATRAYEFAAAGSRGGELAWAYYQLADESTGEAIDSALRKSVELAPKELGFRSLRGPALARLRNYDDAAKEFGAAVPAQVDLGWWFARARAYALLGARDLDAYRDLRKSLVHSVENSKVWSKRLEVAWLGTLIPDDVDGFEDNVKQFREDLSKSAIEGHGEWEQIDDFYSLRFGAMLYRLGHYDDALGTLAKLQTKLVEGQDHNGQYTQACAEYFLAMTRHQMGHEFQARRLLDEARATDDALQESPNLPWYWQVELNALRREAKGLIEP